MYNASTPLRISLFGGSTDNPLFVEKYGRGSVISFSCDLKTHVVLAEDRFGFNKNNKEYIVHYSNLEKEISVKDIKNNIVRLVFEYFDVPPIQVFLTNDVYSHGTGLASSSSYFISLIKAVCLYKNINLTDPEICKIALGLEQKININCGYQDPYGCGIGGFKKMDFLRGGKVSHEFLPTEFFNLYDAHLVFTGVTRDSSSVLEDVTKNIEKSKPLLDIVDKAYSSLISSDYNSFIELFNESWIQKKNTSKLIVENEVVYNTDKLLASNPLIKGHKLCGAGNGGFFLAFSEKNSIEKLESSIKINLDVDGVTGLVV